MKRVGIFIEVSNLYHTIMKKYNKKLSYKQYYSYVAELGDIQQAIAYGAQVGKEANGFITCLREIGYLPKYKEPKEFLDGTKKANWDIGITIDIVKLVDKLDIIVLGSADSDFAEVVKYAQDKGASIIVLACNISHELRAVANKCIEIPESMLE